MRSISWTHTKSNNLIMNRFFTTSACLLLSGMLVISSCDDGEEAKSKVKLTNHSSTPTFLKKLSGFERIQAFSLMGSADQFAESPSFVFGGSADGAAVIKNSDGSFTMLVNHEDNFAVSRIALDNTFKPVKGEYLLNSTGGKWRLCSATLATQDEHGFGPLYLTCGESGAESRTHAINPMDDPSGAANSRELEGLGRWSAENAVPLPKTAYSGKTLIVIGDDDSGTDGGQLAMYVSNTVGDLNNGSLYVLRTVSKDPIEKNITLNAPVNVEFAQINNHKALTGAQINAESTVLKSIQFGRVEDIDYRKDGVGREVYFNVTGQDGNANRTKYGRVYKLVLDANDPLKGQLTLVLDGDDRTGKAGAFQDPDNILVTENYAYIQEDPNGYAGIDHDAYLYQYNLATGELKTVFELDHFRGNSAMEAIYGASTFGSWEYGAMLDVSDIVGIPNTFTLCIQPHTWKKAEFKGVDGGSVRPNEDQGSQIVVIKGLPR